MELALRFFLFLRKLITFFRKRWDQSTRRLWYIFALIRSRVFPKSPKRRDEIRRNVEPRLAKPPTTVICASRFPPPLTPIVGGDTPIASPIPVSIQIRQPTILNPDETVNEVQENPSGGYLGVDGYFLAGSGPISRSLESPTYHHEPESIDVGPPLHQEDHDNNSPVIPSRPTSQYFSRPALQYPGYRPPSEISQRPPSQYSARSAQNLNGAEVAARGYLNGPPSSRCSSPALSVRPPSFTGSVASHVYRASRPATRVPRRSPMRNRSQRRTRPPTPASAHHSVHNAPPELPRPESRTSGSLQLHRDRPSTTVSFGPAPQAQSKETLRPMAGIDRYGKQMKVVIEGETYPHVCPPVTTEFLR